MIIKGLVFSFQLLLCSLTFCEGSVPRFLAEPQSAIVRPGSPAVLRCSVDADGPGSVAVRWTLNGTYLAAQRRRGFELRDGGTVLRIPSFNHSEPMSHEGVYQCVATNAIGSVVSREAKLEAAALGSFAGPAAVRSTTDLTVIDGNVAVVPCSLPESRPRAAAEFLLNGTALVASGRHVLLPSGSLQIDRVSATDKGLYQCSAVNSVIGSRIPSPASFRLRVIVPKSDVSPMFTATPSESVTVRQDSNLTLECAAEGWPVPQITWEKYGGHLPVGRFSQVLGNLIVSRIQRFDAGTYLCRVNKSNGQSMDKVINVDVLEPPSIETGPEDQTSTEGSTIVFKCRPSGSPKQGSPKPSIQWLYNGEVVTNEQFVTVRDTTLTLSNIRRRQSGIYQCIVRNSLGLVHAAARLVVVDPHAQPKIPPSVQPTFADQPNAPDDDEENPGDGEEEYDVYEDSDNGNWSPENEDFTEGDRPAPSKPKVSVLGNTSVLLNWAMTQPSSDQSAVEMFKVKVKEVVADESSSKWVALDDDISYGLRMFEVRGLRPGRTYRFRLVVIYADNERKAGPVSSKVTLASMGSTPPVGGRLPSPVIVEAHSVSKNKIYIGWQQPDFEQRPVESFFVYFNPFAKSDNVRKIKLSGSGPQNYVLSDLTPGTAYSVRMRSFGKSGEKSGFSNAVVKETLGDDTELAQKDNHPGQPEGQELTRDVSAPKSDRQMTYVIIGIVLGVVVIVVVSAAFVCVWKRQRKQQYADGELKHVEQTTAFLSSTPADGRQNALVNVCDYTYKADHNGHAPNCSAGCGNARPLGAAGVNGLCTARDGRSSGSAAKSLTQPKKMAPDLVLPPPPPSLPPPFHQYRTGDPEMSIYDTVDDDRGKVSPAYAKVSSGDSEESSTGAAFSSQESLADPASRPPPHDRHPYWVLEQARIQAGLPPAVGNAGAHGPLASSLISAQQNCAYRQNLGVPSQPCGRMAKTGSGRGDPLGRDEEDELDHYEHMISPEGSFKVIHPMTLTYNDGGNPPNCCEPLLWPPSSGGVRPGDRFLPAGDPPGRRTSAPKPPPPTADPASCPDTPQEASQDSWKALTSQVSNGQYQIQCGPTGPSFAPSRANDYPPSDQEDCR